MSRSSANSRICRRLSRLRLDPGYNSAPFIALTSSIALPQLSQVALSKLRGRNPGDKVLAGYLL